MAQADYNIANQSGSAFRSELNSTLSAVLSLNSGSTAPTTTVAYSLWADTTTGLLKIRDSSNSAFVTIGTMGAANLGLAPLANPTFTGVPAVPNAAPGTNTTQIANTAFVTTALTTGNISTTGSITTTSTLSVQSLTFGRGGGANVNNTAAGANALVSNSGGADNTAMGNSALRSNTSGTGNTGIGFQSLYTNTTANFSTALGLGALFTNNAANNTAVGVGALKFNSSGANNTAIGAIALENNTTGSNNVGIGYSVASSSTTVSNEVNISNGTVNARYQGAASAWTFLSDVRDKTDIENLALGLDFITALKPRKFKWNLRNTEVDRGKPSAGFIAQEVLQTVEAFGASYTNLIDTNDPNQYTFAQANMIPILVKAVQELSAMVKQLQSDAA